MTPEPRRPLTRRSSIIRPTRAMARRSMLAATLLLLCSLLLSACGGAQDPAETTDTAAPPPMAEVETASGECVLDPPAGATACTMDYRPVCGCDGKTYGNACMARGAGVPRFEPGECAGGTE